MIILMATGTITLTTRGEEVITRINMIMRIMIAIPAEIESTISFLISKEIILKIRIITTTSHITQTMLTTTDLIVRQTTTRDMEDNHLIDTTIFKMVATNLREGSVKTEVLP